MGQTLEKLVNVENMLKIFYMRFLENKQNKYNDTIMLNMWIILKVIIPISKKCLFIGISKKKKNSESRC